MDNILITGGAGFIGSNFISYILNKYQEYSIINLDKLTYAGSLENLKEVENHNRYTFVKGDIIDENLVENIFKDYDIRNVIHFAAESHVDNSIETPLIFTQSNVVGTHVLLNVAYKYWFEEPFKYKKEYNNSRFHHISTDEVYGTLGKTGYFTENTPYTPNSPYSASKASSDMLVRSYFHTYRLNTIITNCSNNYGQKQHDEKLIPTIIRNALKENKIPIYGDGKNIRDWLYVEDHCNAIDIVFHKGKEGETYNIGGNNEQNNLDLAKLICSVLDKEKPRGNNRPYSELITFVKDRPGHDKRYAIDSSKIFNELEWEANSNFEDLLLKTIKWYINKYDSGN